MKRGQNNFKKIKGAMKKLGTYNANFDMAIEITAGILDSYEEQKREFEKNGSEMICTYTNRSGIENVVKNPQYLALEKLRSDVVIYLRELGLTPQGLKKLNALKVDDNSNEKTINDLFSDEL